MLELMVKSLVLLGGTLVTEVSGRRPGRELDAAVRGAPDAGVRDAHAPGALGRAAPWRSGPERPGSAPGARTRAVRLSVWKR